MRNLITQIPQLTPPEHPNVAALMETLDEEAILFDGFEDAIIGTAAQYGRPTVACYSLPECLRVLRERDGMTEEMAQEWMEFNTLGSYVGEYTPVFSSPLGGCTK